MTKKNNQLPHLPHELIIQILSRLPVKSLIRFKCVCKSWFSLISDPQFTNSQFQLTASTHIHRALFLSVVLPYDTLSVDLESSLDDDSSHLLLNPNFIPFKSYPDIKIKGSCRGFILLHCSSAFYLWNPSTEVHKTIPLSPLGLNLDAEYFYGFGYDCSKDDYLIVSMSYDTNSPYLEFSSIRANTWKQIDLGSYIRYTNSMVMEDDPRPGLFFNGAIHWLAHSLDLRKNVIVAFDLMEKKLLDMHLPDDFISELDYCGLWVFREFLSIWSMDYRKQAAKIWVMKEYKVHSSWTMTHVLPHDTTLYFFPLRSTKRGDIVGVDDEATLMKYSDDGQLLGHRSYYIDLGGSDVVMYTESLLSLPGDNVQA